MARLRAVSIRRTSGRRPANDAMHASCSAYRVFREDADMLLLGLGDADSLGGVIVKHTFFNTPVQEGQQVAGVVPYCL